VFIGHFALGLAAKRVAPRTSLGTLFAAPTLADLLWPVFLLTGWERVSIVPGPNPFLTLRLRTGYARGAVVVALLVVSHWVLDFATHVPDMPLYPGSPRVGLGLWHSVAGTVIVEGLMLAAGTWIYLRATRARDAAGRYGLRALLALLVVSYVGSLFTGPPPTLRALEIGGIVFGWLFVLLAAWADRHREPVA